MPITHKVQIPPTPNRHSSITNCWSFPTPSSSPQHFSNIPSGLVGGVLFHPCSLHQENRERKKSLVISSDSVLFHSCSEERRQRELPEQSTQQFQQQPPPLTYTYTQYITCIISLLTDHDPFIIDRPFSRFPIIEPHY